MHSHRNRSGFTTLEVIIAVVIVMLMASVAIPSALSWYGRNLDTDAQNLGSVLDAKKARYLSDGAGDAVTAWASAANDQAKYSLIKGYLSGAPANLGDGTTTTGYTKKGYLITLNGLNELCTVTRIKNNVVVYPGGGSGTSYLITASSSNASQGTVSGGGTYSAGSVVTLSAVPFNGYQFVRWREGAVQVSTDASFTFVVGAAHSYTADFTVASAGTYALTMLRNTTLGGSISPGSSAQVEGSVVNLTATPYSNWVFDSWSGDIGSASATSTSINVTMDQNRTVQANFIRASVTLSLGVNNASYGSVSGGGTIAAGTSTTIYATAYPGFQFNRWSDGGTTISTSATLTLSVSTNRSLTAEFGLQATTGVVAGSYGSPSSVPKITVDAQGRVLDVQDTPISVDTSSLGFGDMAKQNSPAVNITGGSVGNATITNPTISGGTMSGNAINASTIGSTNPALGNFTQVGVGTTSPGTKFVVDAGSGASLPAPIDSSTVAQFANTDSSGTVLELLAYGSGSVIKSRAIGGSRASMSATGSGTTMLNFAAFGHNGTAPTTTPAARFLYAADGNWSSTNQGVALIFEGTPNGSTAKSEWMRLQGGNVGIGTSSPGYPLDVAGTINASSSGHTYVNAQTTGTDGTNAALRLFGGAPNAKWLILTNRSTVNGAADSLGFYKELGTTGAKMVIQDNGNVGIGNINPGDNLDINVADNHGLTLSHASGYGTSARLYRTAGDGTLDLYTGNNPTQLKIHLAAGGNSYFTNGNVGIGTTSPASTLQVGSIAGGNSRIGGGSWSEYWVNEAYPRTFLSRDGAASGVAALQFGGGASPLDTTIQRLPSGPGVALMGGNVGVGTTAPTTTLDVQGMITTRSAAPDVPANATESLRMSYIAGADTTLYRNSIFNEVSSASNMGLMQFRVNNGTSSQATVMSLSGSGNVSMGGTLTAGKFVGNVTASSLTLPNDQWIYTADGAPRTYYAANGTSHYAAPSGNHLFRNSTGSYPISLNSEANGIQLSQNGGFVWGLMADNDYWKIYGRGASNAGEMVIETGDDGTEPIVFQQAGTERVRIDSNGSLVTQKMAINNSGGYYYSGYAAGSIAYGMNGPGASYMAIGPVSVASGKSGISFGHTASPSGTMTSDVVIGENGRVGIGTTTPDMPLHISSGDLSFAHFGPNVSNGASLYVGAGGNMVSGSSASIATTNGNLHIDSASSHQLYLNYYNNNDTYINYNGGNISIGYGSQSNVDINGVLKGHIKRGSYGSISIGSSTNGYSGIDFQDANQTFMVNNGGLSGMYRNDNTWLWYFDSSGSLGAGTVPWGRVTGTPSSLVYYQGFTLDANTMDTNATGFTYSVNAPTTGPIVNLGAGSYSMEFNGNYGSGGTHMYYRTRNGDGGPTAWNSWYELIHSGNIGSQTVSNVSSLAGTWTGINYFCGNKGGGSYISGQNSYPLEAYSGDGGAAAMSFHRGGYYAVNFGLDPDNVLRIGGWSAGANRWQLDMSGNQTIVGSQTVGGDYLVSNIGQGLVGIYDSTRYQNVFAMGTSWRLAADGTSPGNFYGIAWTHSNAGGQSKAGLSHQALFMINGITQTAIGQGIWTIGGVTATNYNATSARKYKENIKTLDTATMLKKVGQLRPVQYDWKPGQGKGGHDIGFIADEVDAEFKEAVGHEPNGEAASVDYGRLVVPAVAAIQELETRNALLEKRVALLESRFSKLEDRTGANSAEGLSTIAYVFLGIAGGALITFVGVRRKF